MINAIADLDLEILETPEYLTQEQYWVGHIPFAFWIVAQLKPRIFVELGTYKGDSYCSFCQAVMKLNLDTYCFAVDNWTGDIHYGQYGEEIFEQIKNYHDPKYSHFSKLIRADFDAAVELFENNSIDLLHIDGMHTYNAIRNDFETWFPKLSDRAVVLFHDISEKRESYAVWEYWEELISLYPYIAFSHSSGLGVLFVGSNVPNQLLEIASSPEKTKQKFIELFRCLGERITLKSEMANQRLWYEKELSENKQLQESSYNQIRVINKDLDSKKNYIDALINGSKERNFTWDNYFNNSSIKGGLEGVKYGIVSGWLSPAEEITVKDNDLIFDTFVPDMPRLDVVEKGYSLDLYIGIYYRLTWEKLNHKSISFVLKRDDKWVDIPNSPLSLDAARRDAQQLRQLLAEPPFQLLRIIKSSNDIIIVGILISYAHDVELDLTLQIDGKPLEHIEWEDMPSEAQYFFWYLPTKKTTFKFTISNALTSNKSFFRLNAVYKDTMQPVNQFRFIDIPVKFSSSNMPDSFRQLQVSGWADDFKFWTTGYAHMKLIMELIKYHGQVNNWESTALLDWGCGCGRITRHFIEEEVRPGRIVGTDIIASNIDWCKKNLVGAEFFTTGLLPPLHFTDESFDFIVANSVFTHLNEFNQDLWLIELNRILKPDGLAIFTVNQDTAFAYSGGVDSELLANWRDKGIFNGPNDNLKDALSDKTYYQDTYHTKKYILSHWQQYMKIIAIHESVFGYQNAVILKKILSD